MTRASKRIHAESIFVTVFMTFYYVGVSYQCTLLVELCWLGDGPPERTSAAVFTWLIIIMK